MPGAVETTFVDSAKYVFRAAQYAITDEGLSILMSDAHRQLLETDYVDIGSLKASTSRESYVDNERLVKFRFRTLPTFGATRLIGEVVYRPLGGGGRALEHMVPKDHAGREVLARLFERIDRRLREEREERARKQRETPAPS